jgi:hypothetical protein
MREGWWSILNFNKKIVSLDLDCAVLFESLAGTNFRVVAWLRVFSSRRSGFVGLASPWCVCFDFSRGRASGLHFSWSTRLCSDLGRLGLGCWSAFDLCAKVMYCRRVFSRPSLFSARVLSTSPGPAAAVLLGSLVQSDFHFSYRRVHLSAVVLLSGCCSAC